MSNMKFRKTISILLVIVTLLSMLVLSSCSVNKDKNDKDNESATNNYTSFNDEYIGNKITDEKSAIEAISSIADSLGITDVEKELKVESVDKVGDESFYRMQQYYNDYPVYGKNIVVSADEEGNAGVVTANTIKIENDADLKATVSQDDVEKSINNYIKKNLDDGDEINLEIPDINKCTLYIYVFDDGTTCLAYLIQTGFYNMVVNAQSAEVVEFVTTIYTDKSIVCYNGDGSEEFDGYYTDSDSKYLSYDSVRGINVSTYDGKNSRKATTNTEPLKSNDAYFGNVESNNNTEVDKEYEKGVTLINNLSDIYEYYYKTFGEKAYGLYYAFYNDGYYSGKNALGGSVSVDGKPAGYLSMGSVTGVTDIDIIAHEYTHIVSRSIVNWDDGDETGAVNEAYSDLFGVIIEGYLNGTEPDWVMEGDNLSLKRNIASPSSTKYPEKVSDKNKSGEDYTHAYSTVISHAAYSMWNGIDGQADKKIDTELLAKIWYRSLLFLHSDATFESCADAVYKSAKTLKGVTDKQLECIVEAFNNAEINVSSDSSTATNSGALLHIKDVNLKNYGNYHLKIYNISNDIRNPQLVDEKDITDNNGYALNYNEGTYRIVVTDNDANGSKKEYYKTVRIISNSFKFPLSPVTINTDFGGIFADDFTMPDNLNITLGELGVIEPEIIPLDATSYSIKWTSSDEKVATVSPTGEAGIITSLAKGTTTITAELISGGKTITKSTEVKVGSKARDTVLVLDVSGSMYGEPIEEMKKSAIQFCNDLLKDEYNNRVGIVFYDDSIITIDLTNNLNMLISRIESIDDGGTTDMEAGLSAANSMLMNNSKDDTIKNVVVMADGLPNRGKTSYSGSMPSGSYSGYSSSVSYANAVIDTAKSMMNKYNLYSLGFFHGLYGDEKDFATALMKELTNQNDGYHQVDKAEDLQFAFGDISEEINIGSKIVINIACPVDVKVSFEGEMLSSGMASYCDATSFGTLQLIGKDKDIKVLSLDSDKEYNVELIGTGNGKMDYSVNYFDASEKLSDYRSFETVPITTTTIINSTTNNTNEVTLNIDEDGDGEVDSIWTALSKSKGTITYEKNPPAPEVPVEVEAPVKEENSMSGWVIALIVVLSLLLVGGSIIVLVIISNNKKPTQNDDFDTDIPAGGILICSRCGKSYHYKHGCECWHKNAYPITDDIARVSGTIQVTNGSMSGFTVPIKDGETLYLGKDPKMANLVFTNDYKNVSRIHCSVTFDAELGKYFVVDSSTNGTYFIGKKRLTKGKRTPVKINTVLLLANDECTILLN